MKFVVAVGIFVTVPLYVTIIAIVISPRRLGLYIGSFIYCLSVVLFACLFVWLLVYNQDFST